MAAAGPSLKPFSVGLAVVALVGAGLIGRSLVRRNGGAVAPPAANVTVAAAVGGPLGVPLGADSAPVEIAEYSDFECPYCASFAILQMPDIRERLIASGRLRWRFMHYPLGGHRNSPTAHLAAACAHEQGRFWPMHDAIYASQDDWVPSRRPERVFRDHAQRIGLDRGRYESCMRERRPWAQIEADRVHGDSLGVSGTPTFFLNGRMLATVPAYDGIKALVDSVAAATSQATPAPRAIRR